MCVIDPLLNQTIWQEIGDIDEAYLTLQLRLGQCRSGHKYSERAAKLALEEYKCQHYLHNRFPQADLPMPRMVDDVHSILEKPVDLKHEPRTNDTR